VQYPFAHKLLDSIPGVRGSPPVVPCQPTRAPLKALR
jgi:hypothetical protein